MTSKEALEHLIKECMFIFWYDNSSKAIETIKQDLERLEQLEKEYYSLNKEFEDIEFENYRLRKENEKLKQVIEILKKYLHLFSNQSIPEVAWVEDYYLSLTGNDWCIEIIQEEYELLKEVLGNE